MKMNKKVRQKLMVAVIIMIAFITLLFVVWVIISPGTIRKYKG